MEVPKMAIVPLPRRPLSDRANPRPKPPANTSKKRTRASKPRVKSGCLTCKFRHVKCDETKPNCTRCSATGRVCDGYAVEPAARTELEYALLKLPLVTSSNTLCELRAFSRFRNHSAPILASFFDSQFWMRLVLQMSSADDAVRHAVIAFETLSERMSLGTTPSQDHRFDDQHYEDWRNDSFAITHYNKAIECLTRSSTSTSSVDVVMFVCVLFICIEALRGEIDTATMHFNNGMKTALSRIPGAKNDLNLSATEHMDQVLPLLCRIELLSTLFGNSPSWPYPLSLSEVIPHEFASVAAARDSMIHIMNIIMRFVQDITPRRYQRRITVQDYAWQAELQEALKDWSTKLDTTFGRTAMPQDDLLATQMLRMHHLIAFMMLSRATEIEECAADKLLPEFEKTISLAETIAEQKIQQHRRTSTASNVFLLDMELVSPTYFVAIKCRHPRIRRRAIALLSTLHRREGFFESSVATATAKRIVSIEEADLAVLDGSEWPKEKNRVHHTDIRAAFKLDGKEHKSTFYMRPDGLDAPWRTIQKVIKVGDASI